MKFTLNQKVESPHRPGVVILTLQTTGVNAIVEVPVAEGPQYQSGKTYELTLTEVEHEPTP